MTGIDGGGNIDADPLFVDATAGNFHLQPGSPAIDRGDNSLLPDDVGDLNADGNTGELLPLDLDKNPRLVDGDNNGTSTVDMGPYEFCTGATTPACLVTTGSPLHAFTADVDATTVILRWQTLMEDKIVGFRLYRISGSEETAQLVDDMIPSKGSVAAGANYELIDQPGEGSFTYALITLSEEGIETKASETSAQLTAFICACLQ